MSTRATTMESVEPSPDEVRTYYDTFLRDRMLGYRIYGNPRIRKVTEFFTNELREDDTILDIGCGIGIATEAMARTARLGAVVGLDISPQNIWYARRTVDLANVSFHCLDIISDADQVRMHLLRPATVVTLADVIEHIPEGSRSTLLKTIARIGSDDLKVLLTFPSEFYQAYAASEDSNELQIIDNIVTPLQLAREAAEAGLSMTYFRLVGVWKHVQYAHCVLERTQSLHQRVRQEASPEKLAGWRQQLHRVTAPFVTRWRRRKYVRNVFGKTAPAR